MSIKEDQSEEFKMSIKDFREHHFPVALLEKAYTIRVELGKASVKSYFECCLQVQRDFLDSHLSSSTFQFTQMKMKMDCNNVRQTLTDGLLRLMRKEKSPLDLSTHATMSIWSLKKMAEHRPTKLRRSCGTVVALNLAFRSFNSTKLQIQTAESMRNSVRPSVRPRYGSHKFYPKVGQIRNRAGIT